MKTGNQISEKWIKASIIGTIWAASEIVLGSFLHNLKIPFSGNILTGIGLTILISVSYIWREKGLYWRAGIICALMKTLSPSAFIFGPMIAIFAESLLLEMSVRVLGKTVFGFIAGSMLAMSWNLFQKAINLIIFYGNNLIDLYTNMVSYAEKQLNVHFDIFWLPLVILLVLYCIFGALVAIVGIRTGHRVTSLTELKPKNTIYGNPDTKTGTRKEFGYSITWLFVDIILIIGLLILVSKTKWIFYIPAVSLAVAIWSLRYKRALRQISKPGFWILFVLLTMISAFFFTGMQAGEKDFIGGILIGLEMNFRAIIIIIGFTVLGTELYNPKIRDLFMKTYFRQLPLALELSVESLPSMIASIPDFKTLVRNPVSILSAMISGVEDRLNEIRITRKGSRKIFILTGDTGEGKTTFIMDLVEKLKNVGIKTGGLYSPRLISEGQTTGYDIVDIQNEKRTPFLSCSGEAGAGTIGRFSINRAGLKAGNGALKKSNLNTLNLVIIDEVGPLELKGGGWNKGLSELLSYSNVNILLVVRRSIIDKVTSKWELHNLVLFDITVDNPEDMTNHIIRGIS